MTAVPNTPLPDDLRRVPDSLKALKQWVLWRGQDRCDPQTGKVKLNKIPVDPQTLKNADTTDATTWNSYEYCMQALPTALEEWQHDDPAAYRGGGIGFVFTDEDPFVGIDLDSCVDPSSHAIADWAQAIVTQCASYTELSPSSTGLHVIVEGTLPPHGRRKDAIEMYNRARFFTMTGRHLSMTPTTVNSATHAVHALWCRLFGAQVDDPVWLVDSQGTITNAQPWTITRIAATPEGELFAFFAEMSGGWPLARCEKTSAAPGTGTPPVLADAEIQRHIQAASNGAKVMALARGEWAPEYTSQSEADLAFCCHLAFWTRNPAQIDRLFRTTGLLRDKWDAKRGAQTYGQRTITEALARQTVIYTPNPTREDAAQDAGTGRLMLTSLGALLREPDEETAWLVEDMLPASGFGLLVAKPKAGKSTLARNLAFCVARGTDFLGHTTQQGPVIYLALEEKRAEVRRHFRDMGATGTEDIHVYVASAPVDGLQKVREVTEQLKPVLVIIDPLFRLTRVKDGNDYAQVTLALEPLLMLARETNTHVLCVHHAGKANREGGDNILGSTAIFGAVDTALMMRRMEGYRTLQSVQRYGIDLEETVLRYDQKTRTVTLGSTRETEDIAHLMQGICGYLKGQTTPVTEALIDDDVEGRHALRKKALRQLVAEGKVTRHGKGGKGDPFTYSLISVSSEQDSGSRVPGVIVGTTKPESQNGLFSSNDVANSGSQEFAKTGQLWEPEKKAGNQNPNGQLLSAEMATSSTFLQEFQACPQCGVSQMPGSSHGAQSGVDTFDRLPDVLQSCKAPVMAEFSAPGYL